MIITQSQSILKDALDATTLVARLSWPRLLVSWIYTPIGLLLLLLACYGVNSAIAVSHVSFPASVACMILLFFGLLACNAILGDKRTRQIVRLIEIPGNFSLRYINVLFCPAFVLIPLGSAIGGVEVAKLLGLFIVGYVVVFTITAYITRGLMFILGTPKRAMAERAEELGAGGKEQELGTLSNGALLGSSEGTSLETLSPVVPEEDLVVPSPTHDPNRVTGAGEPPAEALPDPAAVHPPAVLRQNPVPLSRAQLWAAWINTYLDWLVYSTLFVFIGNPVYYAANYAMPAQLSLTILAYFTALTVPPRWRRYFHPVLVASPIIMIAIYIMALIHGQTFGDGLRAYRTNTRYIQMFQGVTNPKPGAGDFLSSVLDVSIISLALPMYQYRAELKRSFFPIIIPTCAISLASLFGYPPLCHAISIEPTRALSFPSRSLTLALAQPATQNLSGDLSLVAVIALGSGILGVIIGPQLLTWLRIPEDDYITRGVTMGGNSSAIATALLLTTDPRAAAFSSLSMGLFGAITVGLSSVPALVRIVQGLAGLYS
ncbi:hypothetical protein NA57DRAFT_66125 [Rhizodiscina lignyota]|uniref:Plastidal glycolate/glycerate translocator 1 n=1 Tax=Rhizodiscina lignyota TaxID=1504668 RepID=A0A9P4MAK9_9PEZI|nr:hypothetical protein NA57DRAFT_66125 [Rhizodiscina lignyota]